MPNDHIEFALHHPCGLRIQRSLQDSEVRAIAGVTTRDMGNGYVWYDLPQAEIAGQPIAMSICFFKNALAFLSAVVADEKLDGEPWADWSAAKEQARAEATRRWFADVGYPVGEYDWGTVYAETDIKTGDGCGGINFG